MNKTFNILLVFITISCLITYARDYGKEGSDDSLKNEILTILTNPKWSISIRNESTEGAAKSKELSNNISIKESNICFRNETDTVNFNLIDAGSWISLQHDNSDLYLGYDIFVHHKPFSKSYGPKKVNIESTKCKDELERVTLLLKNYQKSLRNEFYNSEIEKFKPVADKYKKQEEKPQLSEEQRKYIVQANTSNEVKDYYNAIELYEKAIRNNPVSYPAAYNNLALIAAQIKNYRYAIFNMNKYLMLVPEAEDARSAQDKIYEWEAELDK